jgi:arginase
VDRTLTEPQVVALLCRTSDREAGAAEASGALARELGERIGLDARLIGSAQEPRDGTWEDDLRDGRGCLLEAGGQLEDALNAGRTPVLVAADCSICVSTLPVLVRERPDAWVVWLDAHPDFNTPDSSPSGYLGGMCLAGACGLWDTGFGAGLDPTRVVQCGIRSTDGGEQVLLETNGVVRVERPSDLAAVVEGREVFIHLDLDVLDPSVLPFQFPVEGGFSDEGLRTLLAELVEAAGEVVGAEITSLTQAAHASHVADIVEALLGLDEEDDA